MAVDKLHTRAGVSLRIGAANFGRPKGSININDQYGTTAVSDFDTAFGTIADQILEDRTISVSWTANLVTSDAGFTAAETAYEAGSLVTITVTTASVDGTNTKSWSYKGFLSQFNVTLNQTGVAEVAITFSATEVVTT